MDSGHRGRRCIVWIFKPQRHGTVCIRYEQAALISSGNLVPHCLGHPLWSYGVWCCISQSYATKQGAKQRIKFICSAVDRQLFLESDLLQCAGLRTCLFVAAAVMGVGFCHDHDIYQNQPTCRRTPSALSALAHLRSLFKRRCLVSELKTGPA